MLDDLFSPLDDVPRGAQEIGGLVVGEPCATSAELEALAAMTVDPDYQRASEIIFEDVDDQTGATELEASNRRHFADLMASAALPNEEQILIWKAELLAEVWRRYGGAIIAARNHAA